MNLSGPRLRAHREQLGLSQAKLSELSGLSQHVLSAYELQKADLTASELAALLAILADPRAIEALSRRAKRYREHLYVSSPKIPERIARAAKTAGNEEYRSLLAAIAAAHRAPRSSRLSAVSLFSGCGGFSLGFSAAGFHIHGYAERDEGLRAIYRKNFPASVELGSDVAAISERALRDFAAAQPLLDAVIGGPPCQGFSLSGKRKADDPRNTLFRHYLRVVEQLRPRVAILENVRLLTSMKDRDGQLVKDKIQAELAAHGYRTGLFEINAKDYGVPQHRERVMFIGIREDLDIIPSIPDATHGVGSNSLSSMHPYRTFGDACSDLPYLESGESSDRPLHSAVEHPAHVVQWLWDVAEGRSAHDNPDPTMRPPSGYNTTYKRQVWREPASTVQTTFGMISGCRNVHPIATRSLTIREAARIQSFPDCYQFVGSLGVIRTGIGNAVPPLLAYVLANHVMRLIGR